MSVAIQYFLSTNQANLDDWYANQTTTTFGLWRDREVVLLKQDDSLIKKILWKIADLFGLISQHSVPVEIMKEFYIQHKAHQILAQRNTELTHRISELTSEIITKQSERDKLTQDLALQNEACGLLRKERTDLTADIHAFSKTLEKIEADLDKKRVSLRDHEAQLSEAEATITRFETLKSQLSGLQQSIQAAEKKSAKLSSLIERQENLRKEIDTVRLDPNTVLELNTQRTSIEQSMIRLIENGAWIQVDGKDLSQVLREAHDHFKKYEFKDLTWLETLQAKAAALQSSTISTTNASSSTTNLIPEFKALAKTFYTYTNTLLSLTHTGYGLVL